MKVVAIDPGAICTALAFADGREKGRAIIVAHDFKWFKKKKDEADDDFAVRRLNDLVEFIGKFFVKETLLFGISVVIEIPSSFSYARSRRAYKQLNVHALQVNYAMAMMTAYACSDWTPSISFVKADVWKKGFAKDLRSFVKTIWNIDANDHVADAVMLADYWMRTQSVRNKA